LLAAPLLELGTPPSPKTRPIPSTTLFVPSCTVSSPRLYPLLLAFYHPESSSTLFTDKFLIFTASTFK
jgi:hypothetical protein